MNDFKFTLISSFVFIVIIGLGALAFVALEPGDTNGSRQVVSKLEASLAEKDEALQTALRRISELESDNKQLTPDKVEVKEPTTTSSTPTSNDNASLISSLESLKSRGVILAPGNSGPDVGTIQKFLNVYNKTSGGVDNDFGPNMRKRVEAFQADQKISVDGGVGSGTLTTMINWLKNN
jgi:murein L,D-transpeptidase YcbB/YkuD